MFLRYANGKSLSASNYDANAMDAPIRVTVCVIEGRVDRRAKAISDHPSPTAWEITETRARSLVCMRDT